MSTEELREYRELEKNGRLEERKLKKSEKEKVIHEVEEILKNKNED